MKKLQISNNAKINIYLRFFGVKKDLFKNKIEHVKTTRNIF